MSNINTKHFKEKLEQELRTLERELKTVGRKNPNTPGDWEPTPEAMDVQSADPNEVADKLESFEENVAIVRQLEIRLAEVRGALDRIKNDAYGICKTCGEPIEIARLEANPAATTCKAHL